MGSEMTVYQNYESFKAELDGELQKTAEGFVRIGYLLKVARDTNVLTSSGYKTVTEFASAEYGLDKTQVSRFISINDRFSEGGYSDRLVDKYQGFGYAKLTIMLQIPEAITEEMSPNLSKADVQAIKEEVDEEKKVSDIEVMMEEREAAEITFAQEILYWLMKEDRKLYAKCWDASKRWGIDQRTVKELLAPSGEKIYSVRIPGKGREMLFLDDSKEEATTTNTRSGEKARFTWEELAVAAQRWISDRGLTWAESWSWTYAEECPEEVKEEPKEEPKKEPEKPKKESKVRKAEKPKKTGTEAKPKPVQEAATAAVMEPREAPTAAVMEEDEIPTTSFEEITEEKDGNDQSGMSDLAGDAEAPRGSEGVDEEKAGEESGTLQDHGADGAEQGEGSEGDPFGNEAVFQMVDHVKNDVDLLKQISAGSMWYYNEFEIFRAYRAAVNLAADIEKLAKKQGWRIYEE